MVQEVETQAVSSIWDSFVTLAFEFWWLPVIVGIAWYLRWYGKAQDENVSNPAITGLMLTLEDAGRSGKQAIGALIVLGVVMAGFGGWVFNILPTLLSGFAGGDPLTIGLAAVMGFVATAAADLGLATPLRAVILFFVVSIGVWIVRNAIREAGDD